MLDPSIIQRLRRGYPVPMPPTNDQRLREFVRKLADFRRVEPNAFFLAGRVQSVR
jgi:hypothetical protein